MNKWQFRLLAICCWLVAIACGIAFAGLYEEYSGLRDGRAVDATVTRVAPYGKTTAEVELRYDGDQPYKWWPKRDDAPALGATVPLIVSTHGVIRASALAGKKPSILLVAGAIAAILLGAWVWWLSGLDAKRRAARKTPLDIFIDGARRTRNVSIALGILFVVFAGFFVVIAFADDSASRGEAGAVIGLAVVSLLVAAIGFVRGYQLRDPRRNRLVDLVERRASEIVWFYVQEFRGRMKTRVHDAVICTRDGKSERMRLVPEDIDDVLAELARRSPLARRGYDVLIERAYKANPASLLAA